MSQSRRTSYGVLAACIFMIIMNGLSSAGVLGWRTLEDISYSNTQIIVPASYTFAIRWVIYLWLLAFSIYQLRKHDGIEEKLSYIRPLLIVNFIANGLWLPFATATLQTWSPITVVLIGIMWITMRYTVNFISEKTHNINYKLYMITPLSIYYGWLTIATPLNIATVTAQLWYPQVIQTIPWILLWIGIWYITSIAVFHRISNISYICVILRALVWLIVARWNDTPKLVLIYILLIFITFLIILFRTIKKKVYIQ